MIEWDGDLNDDCRAEWKGLYLQAEEMERNIWWWAVSKSDHEQVVSSNESDQVYTNGRAARVAAEEAAKAYLKEV